MNHTPLPWSKRPNNKDVSFVVRSEYSSSHLAAEVVHKSVVDKHALVKGRHGVRLIPYIEGDVDFILHACNHYYEMLSTLAEVADYLPGEVARDVRQLVDRLIDT